MDDPWGSPWAASDSDKDHRAASPAKSDLAPPPRALLSASSSPQIPSLLEQSPWGGDDSSPGEWATASETPPAHSIWAGGWSSSSTSLTPTPRDDMLGRTSPIAWPGNVATPKPTNGSVFRQPSPDPWASGFSSRRPSVDGASTPRLVVEAASPDDVPQVDTLIGDALGIAGDTVWDKPDTNGTGGELATVKPASVTVEPELKDSVKDEIAPPTVPASDVRLSVESATHNREYLSSTPSNDNTDHEEDHQDSPITSIDEDPRTLRPAVSRKVSGKVQELVVKFDGLARAASEERETPPRARSKSPFSVGKRDSDDADDFGDFEEGVEDEQPPDGEPEGGEPEGGEDPDVSNTSTTLSPAADRSAPRTSPIAMFGPLNFGVDLDLVAKLFTGLPEPAGDANADYNVPDHVISDSFTEISERKTWYRISRLGSSRRHNAGDDESYRRVAWPSSTVHHDTIKIVRRWMEEDSIAGRVALGGGISKTQKNMFGWDSTAEPIALDAVFGKKRSHRRVSTTVRPLTEVDGPTKQSLQGPMHRPTGSAGPTLASFGWSSSFPAPMATEHQAPNAPATHSHPVLAPPTPTTPSPLKQVSSSTHLGSRVDNGLEGSHIPDDDDDDEWGEMVSSPVTAQPLVTPIAAAFGPQSDDADSAAHSTGDAPDDPWGADFCVFKTAPAKSVFRAHSPTTITESVELPARVPAPTPKPVAAAAESLVLATTSEPQAPSSLTGPPKTASNDGEHQHQEDAAQQILANLPDLSYMLR